MIPELRDMDNVMWSHGVKEMDITPIMATFQEVHHTS